MRCIWNATLISLVFFINTALAESANNFRIESGLWEGISDAHGADYYLLQINDDGDHKLIIGNIASAFRYTQLLSFDNNNIKCTPSECILSVINPADKDTNLRLVISPYLDSSLRVLQMSIDDKNKVILSSTYQLDKKSGKSTIREFVDAYRERIVNLENKYPGELFGIWIGIANIRDKKQLVILDYNFDSQSEFALMSNGKSGVVRTFFNKSDVLFDDGLAQISTSHATFANKIILHKLTKGMLQGHAYSYYEGQAIESFDFTLYRVESGEGR